MDVGAEHGRRLGVAAWAAIAIEALVGAAAIQGGWMLIADGGGMPIRWREGTPFPDWFVPGMLLIALVAVPMLTAAILVLVRHRLGAPATIAAGAILVTWIVGQVVVLGRYFFLQPVLAVIGLAILGLGLSMRHGEGGVHPSWG